jgi:N-glycosylase/DNA lyase
MNDLHEIIGQLKHSTVRMTIQQRIQDFKTIQKDSSDELFQELCFCILTANFSAERCLQIHSQLKACFCTETKDTLAQKLKENRYRFPNTRAAYIVESASKKDRLPTILMTLKGDERRTWLVQNIKGLGYKEASHFLRNIGYDDYAIIDSHILDILARYRLITRPKTLTKKTYIEIETILRRLAHQTQLTLAELDLYLWYLETGKILK